MKNQGLIFFSILLLLLMSSLSHAQNTSPKAEIKVKDGTPTMFVNGEATPAMTYMTYNPKEKFFSDFGRAGVNFVSFNITANYNPRDEKNENTSWLGDRIHSNQKVWFG